jgi:hypothetical protein
MVFTLSSVHKTRQGTEVTQSLDVPGEAHNGLAGKPQEHTSAESGRWFTFDGFYRPERGFWSLGWYCRERLLDVLELLPREAHVSFDVQLDAGTNEYLVRADCAMAFGLEQGLHADRFMLIAECMVRGKRKVRSYLIDETVGAHNSARFGVR